MIYTACIYGLTFVALSSSLCSASNTSTMHFYDNELESLSELPLEKLLKIKSSIAKKLIDDNDEMPEARTPTSTKRMSNKMPMRRHEVWDDKGKDSKISKIFQLTITALSFLAFGGYLMTLVITAIRRGQNVTNPGVIVLSGINNLQKVKRPKRGISMFDPAENTYDTEKMYRGMIMLSSDFSRHFY